MRYMVTPLFVLGFLGLIVGFGLENCTQGATDKIRLSIYTVIFFHALSFLFLLLDSIKSKRLSLFGFFPIILISLIHIYWGFVIIVAGEDFIYCDGWTVPMLLEYYSDVAWFGWAISATGLSGLTIAWLWVDRGNSSLPESSE